MTVPHSAGKIFVYIYYTHAGADVRAACGPRSSGDVPPAPHTKWMVIAIGDVSEWQRQRKGANDPTARLSSRCPPSASLPVQSAKLRFLGKEGTSLLCRDQRINASSIVAPQCGWVGSTVECEARRTRYTPPVTIRSPSATPARITAFWPSRAPICNSRRSKRSPVNCI